MSRLNDPYLSKTLASSGSSSNSGGGVASAISTNNGQNNKRPVIPGPNVSSAKKESLEELKKQKLSAYTNNPVARLSTQAVKNPFEETNQQLVGEVDKLRRELAERAGHIQSLDGENFQLREYINKLEVESMRFKELYDQSQLDLERRQLELDDWREQFLILNEKYNEQLAKQQLEVKRVGKSSMISMMQLEEVEEEESHNMSMLNLSLTGDEGPAEAMRVFVKINQLMDKYIQRMSMCRKLSNKISYIFSKNARLSIDGNNQIGNNTSPYIIQPTQRQSQQFLQPAKSTKRRTTRRSSMLFVTNNDTGALIEAQQQHVATEQQQNSPVRANNKSISQSQRIEAWPNSGASSNYHHLQHMKLGEGRRSANESNKSIRDEVMQEEEEVYEEYEEEPAGDKNISIQSDEQDDDEEQDVVEDTQQEEGDEDEEEEEEEEEEDGDAVEENNMDQNGLDVILESTEVENSYNRSQIEEREDMIEEEEEEVDTEAVESQAETIEDDTEPETETVAEPVNSKYTGPGGVHPKPPEVAGRSFLPNSTYVIDAGDPSPNITSTSIKIAEEKTKGRTRRSQQPVQTHTEKEDRPAHQQHNSSRNVRFEEDSDEGGASPVTTFKKTPFKHRSTSSLAEKATKPEEPELNDSIENVKKLNIKPKPILRKSASMTQLDEAKPIADTPAMSKSKSIFLNKQQKEIQAVAASPAPPKPDTEEEAGGKTRRGRRKTIEHNNKDYDSVSNYLEEIVEQAAVSDSTNYTHSTNNRSRGRGRPRSTARANPDIVEVETEPSNAENKEATTNTKPPVKKNTANVQSENNNENPKPQLPPLPPSGARKQQKRPYDLVSENSGVRNLPPPAPARPPIPPAAAVATVAPAPLAQHNKNVLAPSNTQSAINLKATLSTPKNNTSPKKMKFTPPEENDSSHAYNPHDDSGRAGCNASLGSFNPMSAGLEGSARRARKPVSYKEIPLNCKVRRDEKNQVVYKNLEKKGIMNPDEDLAARYNKENAMPN